MNTDVKTVAKVLARANMSEDERKAWLRVIPLLRQNELEKLVEVVHEESDDLLTLRSTYLNDVQSIVDQARAEQVSAALS